MSIIPFPRLKGVLREAVLRCYNWNLREMGQLVTLDGVIVEEWDMALRFALNEYAKPVLIPKSEIVLQAELPQLGAGGVCIEIPRWLAEREGLV